MSEGGFFGPALPPDFKAAVEDETIPNTTPVPTRKRGHSSVSSDSSESSASSSGHQQSDTEAVQHPSRTFGPALPPPAIPAGSERQSASSSTFIGPILPSSISAPIPPPAESDDDDSDDDMVGPIPNAEPQSTKDIAIEGVERRAKRMKDKLLGVDNPDESSKIKSREEWMTELPPEMSKNFGVSARKFSTKIPSSADKDRSVWTDTPADRARKEQERLEGKAKPIESVCLDQQLSATDKIYRDEVDEYNKLARPKSLLEMHTEKLQDKSSHHSKKKRKKSKDDKSSDEKRKKSKKRDKEKDKESKKKKVPTATLR